MTCIVEVFERNFLVCGCKASDMSNEDLAWSKIEKLVTRDGMNENCKEGTLIKIVAKTTMTKDFMAYLQLRIPQLQGLMQKLDLRPQRDTS